MLVKGDPKRHSLMYMRFTWYNGINVSLEMAVFICIKVTSCENLLYIYIIKDLVYL